MTRRGLDRLAEQLGYTQDELLAMGPDQIRAELGWMHRHHDPATAALLIEADLAVLGEGEDS